MKPPRRDIKGKLVWCAWLDSCSRDGWFGRDELDAWVKELPTLCETTGKVIAVTGELLVLATSVSPDCYGGAWAIPWFAITKLVEIVDV